MAILFVLDLEGDFESGFRVRLEIWSQGLLYESRTGELPPAEGLTKKYVNWQSIYRSLGYCREMGIGEAMSEERLQGSQDCASLALDLCESMNHWLKSESFLPIRDELLVKIKESDEEVRAIVRSNNSQLRRLPWHKWDLLERFSQAEIAVSPQESTVPPLPPPNPECKVRVLAILARDDGINIQEERQLLEKLPDSAITFLVKPQREELYDFLWEESWNVIFFLSYSKSDIGGSRIDINETDSLTLEEIRFAMRKTVANGLDLAIFNCGDGLELAEALELLHIPQMIVMREVVPDKVAREFLIFFLREFSGGKSLYGAVREAREYLERLEYKFPCATWLPVIWQNLTVVPPTWQELAADRFFPEPPPQAKRLQAMPSRTTTTLTSSNRNRNKNTKLGLKTIAATVVLCLTTFAFSYRATPYFLKSRLEAKALTIGTLCNRDRLAPLVSYLQNHLLPSNFVDFLLGKKIAIAVDGDNRLLDSDAQNKLERQDWDIAFTCSAIVSGFAKEKNYTFAALMFPQTPRYQAALYVKANSSIQSIKDINSSTVIALGNFNSVSSFYMPVYDLFGKSLKVDIGHPDEEIRKLVKTGKADVGSGYLDKNLQKDSDLRIIHKTRDVPSPGVYLAPQLSAGDRATLENILLAAPEAIRSPETANYGLAEEPDYKKLMEIARLVETIIDCSNWTKNPVNLFCNFSYPQAGVAPLPAANIWVGRVNRWTQYKSDSVILTLLGENKAIYTVEVSLEILKKSLGADSFQKLQNKEVRVAGVTPRQLGGGYLELNVTAPSQIQPIAGAASKKNPDNLSAVDP